MTTELAAFSPGQAAHECGEPQGKERTISRLTQRTGATHISSFSRFELGESSLEARELAQNRSKKNPVVVQRHVEKANPHPIGDGPVEIGMPNCPKGIEVVISVP